MAKKHIFITGISGFIGFHLAKALQKTGHLVIGCDNFQAYYDPKLKLARSHLLKESGIPVIEKDICDTEGLKKLLQDYEITHLVHLAAQAGVRYSLIDPKSYLHSNLEGFISVMEACRSRPEMAFIYASSSSVYGLNEKIPFSEKDQTDLPTSLYGATKKSNELIAHAYHHLFGIRMTGLRFFTVYGPWGRPDMAYYSFTKAILENQPIQVFDNGGGKRDFTYIDDIVGGIIASIDLQSSYEVFNLGNHSPQTTLELISCIEKHTGKTAIKELVSKQPGDVTVTFADIKKSQKKLGFTPKTSLDEGIRNFVHWYMDYRLSQ